MKKKAWLLGAGTLLAGILGGLSACESPFGKCAGNTYSAMDGCNYCSYENPGQGGLCSQIGCDLTLGAEGGCHPWLCVSDMDEAPGLQTDCVYVETVTGDELPPCEGESGDAQLPAGAWACIIIKTGDQLSPACADEGHVLEYEFLFADEAPAAFDVFPYCSTPTMDEWCNGAECYGPGPQLLED